MARAWCLLVLFLSTVVHAQDVTIEYQVKAAYLYNFVKFVDWPPAAPAGPIVICVAGRNPFGSLLQETVRSERVNGRALQARVILEPETDCHVLFVPSGAATSAYLRAARGTPTLTVGESSSFISQGGMVSFFMDGNHVRFRISPQAAAREGLRISSRLLQLAEIDTDSER